VKLLNRLKSTLEKAHYDEAISICENNPSPITNLMRVGIENRQYSTQVIKEAVMDAANMEIPAMVRFLSALGTIAHIAPLLGLLGTVTGNIEAFGVLNKLEGVGDPSRPSATTDKNEIMIFYDYLDRQRTITRTKKTVLCFLSFSDV